MDVLDEWYSIDGELLDDVYDLLLETVLCEGDSIVIARYEYLVQLLRIAIINVDIFRHIMYNLFGENIHLKRR
ncbi:hypothetical protein [Lachnotalea glycerini]|nr:hypothetical protein [Lachnotalea glycerini]